MNHCQCINSRMTVPPPPPPPGGGPPPIPKSVIERKPIETEEIGDPGKIAKTGTFGKISIVYFLFSCNTKLYWKIS